MANPTPTPIPTPTPDPTPTPTVTKEICQSTTSTLCPALTLSCPHTIFFFFTVGVKDITTNEELHQYLNDPKLDGFFPTETEARYLLTRVSAKDMTKTKLNWCRSLDHIQATRAICRNHGSFGVINFANAAGKEGIPVVLLGLPTPRDLFNKVWSIVPEHIRSKVTEWARKKMEGPIAFEIRDYVKQGLGLLPIPIPPFFLNSVCNVAIPALVKFILGALGPVGHVPLLSINTWLINIIE